MGAIWSLVPNGRAVSVAGPYDGEMRRTVAALVAVTTLLLHPRHRGQETFTYTGAPQTWVVPAQVTSATIDAYGAQGGPSVGTCGERGGLGGHAVATVSVVPGDTLYVMVGGMGDDSTATVVLPSPGGYNGGGRSTADPPAVGQATYGPTLQTSIPA